MAEQSAMSEWLGGGTKRRRLEVPATDNNENSIWREREYLGEIDI